MRNQIQFWKRYLALLEKDNKKIRRANSIKRIEIMNENSKNIADYSDGKIPLLPGYVWFIPMPELKPSMEDFMTLLAKGKLIEKPRDAVRPSKIEKMKSQNARRGL